MSEDERFKQGMRRVAGTVCVITTRTPAGVRLGITVTAMCSLSAVPPSLLVCVKADSSLGKQIEECGVFAVNVLGADEQALALTFSGQTGLNGSERFSAGSWRPARTGAPIHASAIVAFDCRVDSVSRHHTHLVVVGRVEETILDIPQAAPLLYREGRFGSMECATLQQPSGAA
jgi:flavin reductase (DIM6/NTAB) family NADH-FMN oxidoreductase RutF